MGHNLGQRSQIKLVFCLLIKMISKKFLEKTYEANRTLRIESRKIWSHSEFIPRSRFCSSFPPFLWPHCSTHRYILGDKASPIFGEEWEARVRDGTVFSMAAEQLLNPLVPAALQQGKPWSDIYFFLKHFTVSRLSTNSKHIPPRRNKACVFPHSRKVVRS